METWSKTLLTGLGAAAAATLGARMLIRRSRWIDLQDKVVFITGGSRGLGLVLAREFAGRGARVAICARNQKELDHVRAEFIQNGATIWTGACDVGDRAEIGKTIRSATDELGEIDVLVNNAGIMNVGPSENQDLEAYQDAMQTHFWGPYFAISDVVDEMKRRRSGRIVNIASVGGKLAFPHLLPYTASKFALVGYSEGLRAELAKYNVFVTTVCPGLMRTGSPRNAEFTGQPEKEYAWFAVSDSLPFASIDARRAARQIIHACVHGEAEIHLGASARLGTLAQGCAPGMMAELFSILDRLLPRATSGPAARRTGAESESAITQNVALTLTRKAEAANNQL